MCKSANTNAPTLVAPLEDVDYWRRNSGGKQINLNKICSFKTWQWMCHPILVGYYRAASLNSLGSGFESCLISTNSASDYPDAINISLTQGKRRNKVTESFYLVCRCILMTMQMFMLPLKSFPSPKALYNIISNARSISNYSIITIYSIEYIFCGIKRL